MYAKAVGPWPCPKDRILIFFPNPFAFARAMRSAIGSAPGDNTKIIGVLFWESPKAPSKSNGGLSINLGPNS